MDKTPLLSFFGQWHLVFYTLSPNKSHIFIIISELISNIFFKLTNMGNSHVWVPGYAPDHCGPPKEVKDYKDDPKGIQAAYRKASQYVNQHPDCAFCTIGPQSWLKCWQVDKGSKAKFKRVDDNVLLYFNQGKLDVEKDKRAELLYQNYEWGYLYF